eukprot:5807319-Pyramimonas_sp.AAC.1
MISHPRVRLGEPRLVQPLGVAGPGVAVLLCNEADAPGRGARPQERPPWPRALRDLQHGVPEQLLADPAA